VVQKEVKSKTRIYGTVAMLSAIILVALIYVFGSTTWTFTPDSSDTPSLPDVLANVSPLPTFKSYDELKSFLKENTQDGAGIFGGGPLDAQVFGSARNVPAALPAESGSYDMFSEPSYSTTNVQVAGVDEADIVKTDGKYIYVASNNDFYSSSQNSVYVLKADVEDPRVIAKIDLGNSTYVAGLFLSEDGSKLVIIGSQYQLYAYAEPQAGVSLAYPYYSSVNTFLSVYDVSEKARPVIARNLTLSGSYFNSRLIGDYVYTVVSQPAYLVNENVVLPQVYEDAKSSEIDASRIYYVDTVDNYFTFTTFIGLNVLDDVQEPTNMTVMMGGASTMFVSLDNIYVTYPTWTEQGQYTSIYRVGVNGSVLTFEAKGNATGYVLNQYSMDEYNGYFRLATTSQKNQTQQNNVYVLNMNLTVVGKLENLAEDERIYSARFMGDKCYLVTFRQVDPFFVLDMSNPADPKVAGELKIPGYSSYLHPYDENHVIGLGKDDSNVKISLFDVSDVNAPKEIAKYVVEGDWTSSEALNEPKAFLFDKQKELLVIPVVINNYGVVDPSSRELAMQGTFWQGAYVFKVTLAGFELKGGVTHQENATQYYIDYNENVNRALYIGNTLYTVSNAKVQLNSLDTLVFIADVNLR
jgi:inhibitor of cysteine peptidase